MQETVNQDTNATAANEQPEQPKTFTQEEVDRIVSDRLSRERTKYADYATLKEKAEQYDASVEASKSELQKATERADSLQAQLDALKKADSVRQIRNKIAEETGVPANLLSGETEEICKEQAEAIKAFANPTGYPVVKDGGEVRKISGGKTRDQFANWFKESFEN